MRLHRIELQAFGPFAATESVDVDALAEQGLFLLAGPTGAGKTSVLDAVCFALYGSVPGARAGGARLRSDHAAEGLAPQVLVEVTVGGRRFEVTRSPAWDRPKKRGSGTTTEPARTLLRERIDDTWVPLSSRNDEASQLLTDVLGMGIEQFTKVVLLPQGDFAAFLQAPAEERRPLLQRLFGTDRFAQVESWLVEERRLRGRELEQAEARLDRLLARVDQAAAVLPEQPDDAEDVAGPAPSSDPAGWVQALAARAATAARLAREAHDAALLGREQAGASHSEATRRADRARRLEAALSERATLLAEAETTARTRQVLAEAEAARSVAGDLRARRAAHDALEAAQSELRVAEQAVAAAVPVLGAGVAGLDDAEVVRLAGSAREDLGRLADLVDVEARAEHTERRRADLLVRRDDALTRRRVLDDELRAVTTERAEHERAVERLTAPAADLPTAARAVADGEAVLAAAAQRDELQHRVAGEVETLTAATDRAQQLRQAWLDLRERRLAGMAAELAADLVDGRPCAVCGAVEHPEPATATSTSVTADAERRAREASEQAVRARLDQEASLSAVREALAVQTAACADLDTELARAALASANQRHETARRASDELHLHRTGQTRAAAREQELTARQGAEAEVLTGLSTELAEVEAALADLRARLDAGRGDDVSIEARRSRLESTATAFEALRSARLRCADALRAADTAQDQADAAAVSAGFDDADAALAAVVDPQTVQALRDALRQHADAMAAVEGRLDQDDLVLAASELAEGGGGIEPATTAMAAAASVLAAAERRSEETGATLALLTDAAGALAVLAEHVVTEVEACAPLREQYAVVNDLASCTGGTGGGNALKMRLSSFVLAARLEQVAAAATVRLHDMSDGRYALVHSDAAERGGKRSGLGLQVVDSWTGAQRETSSLSGGESFLASLALALGLADVVQAEAGGTAIETLFVDEGFGTLDPETLEEVMEILDALRDGGRTIGLISHVPELRQRIPSQLEVVKTQTGSHLRVRVGAAAA